MSNDKAILAAAILPFCNTCRICGCSGDSCSLPAGEKCCWVDSVKTLCSNPRCLWRAELLRKRHREASVRAEARAANMPWWKRKAKKPAQKRRQKKTKGKVA